MTRGRRRVASICLIAAALGGCELFVPSSGVQCKSDLDCTGRGSEFAGAACVDTLCVPHGDRCLGHVAELTEDRTKPLHSRFRIVNVGGTPLKGVELLVCASRDETCESPVGAPVLTDADGYAYLTAWKDFRGTFQVKHPPTDLDYMKVKIHVLGAFEADDKPDRVIPVEQSIHLLTRTLFTLQLAGRAALDANAGQILASASDCDMAPRAGVAITLITQPPTTAAFPFYFSEDQVVSGSATETATGGLFGIVNVPPGPVAIEATIPSVGKRLGRVELWVNKDTISNFTIGPTPEP